MTSNITSSAVSVSATNESYLCYQLCLSRRLLYHAVVLLAPSCCITVVLLTLLITSPSLAVKLPGTMSVVVVSCLLLQFACSSSPSGTLPVIVFYPMSLIVISVTSCCVGLTLRSRDCQTGNETGRCAAAASPKRDAASGLPRTEAGDNDAAQFCQMNCNSSSAVERGVITAAGTSTRRVRVPPVPPAPSNHLNHQQQQQRCFHFQYQTCIDGEDAPDRPTNVDGTMTVDRRRLLSTNSLLLSRSNSRSNIRPSRYLTEVGCSAPSANYIPGDHCASTAGRPGSPKTMETGRHRLDRVERCFDMCLFIILVIICVAFATFLVFMYF